MAARPDSAAEHRVSRWNSTFDFGVGEARPTEIAGVPNTIPIVRSPVFCWL